MSPSARGCSGTSAVAAHPTGAVGRPSRSPPSCRRSGRCRRTTRSRNPTGQGCSGRSSSRWCAAEARAGLAALLPHPVGAQRDRVDRRHLEAGMVEPTVAASDEPEHMVVTASGVEEGHLPVDGVADPQAEHVGVEPGHLLGLGGEQQRVAQPAGHHVLGGLQPLGDPMRCRLEPLFVAPRRAGGPARALGRAVARRCRRGHGATVPRRTRQRGSMAGVPARSSAPRIESAVPGRRVKRRGAAAWLVPAPAGPGPGRARRTWLPGCRPSPRSPDRILRNPSATSRSGTSNV